MIFHITDIWQWYFGMAYTDSLHVYEGCLITFQLSFAVCLRDKLIEVKMLPYKAIAFDHFTIEEKH